MDVSKCFTEQALRFDFVALLRNPNPQLFDKGCTVDVSPSKPLFEALAHSFGLGINMEDRAE
jgi:hypothetical protein